MPKPNIQPLINAIITKQNGNLREIINQLHLMPEWDESLFLPSILAAVNNNNPEALNILFDSIKNINKLFIFAIQYFLAKKLTQKDKEIAVKFLTHPDIDIYILLNYAGKLGHIELVTLMLDMQEVMNYQKIIDCLVYLSQKEKTEAIKAIISHSTFDINYKDAFGLTLLHYAFQKYDLGYIKIMLDQIKNKDDFLKSLTDFFNASMQKKLQLVNNIINSQNLYDIEDGYLFPLIIALENKNNNAVKILIEKEKNITVLYYYLLKYKNGLAAEVIHYSNFNIFYRDKLGRTPLHYACQYNQPHAIKYFLSKKDIEINITDKMGTTPLICLGDSFLSAINRLDKPASIDKINAIFGCHERAMALLLAHPQINIELTNDLGGSFTLALNIIRNIKFAQGWLKEHVKANQANTLDNNLDADLLDKADRRNIGNKYGLLEKTLHTLIEKTQGVKGKTKAQKKWIEDYKNKKKNILFQLAQFKKNQCNLDENIRIAKKYIIDNKIKTHLNASDCEGRIVGSSSYGETLEELINLRDFSLAQLIKSVDNLNNNIIDFQKKFKKDTEIYFMMQQSYEILKNRVNLDTWSEEVSSEVEGNTNQNFNRINEDIQQFYDNNCILQINNDVINELNENQKDDKVIISNSEDISVEVTLVENKEISDNELINKVEKRVDKNDKVINNNALSVIQKLVIENQDNNYIKETIKVKSKK